MIALDNLVSALDRSFGREKREKILSGYGVQGNFFSYGSENAQIEVLGVDKVGAEISGSTQVSIKTFDPVSGEQTGRSQYSFYALNRHYGNIFEGVFTINEEGMDPFKN